MSEARASAHNDGTRGKPHSPRATASDNGSERAGMWNSLLDIHMSRDHNPTGGGKKHAKYPRQGAMREAAAAQATNGETAAEATMHVRRRTFARAASH